jgi:hypothetical protein
LQAEPTYFGISGVIDGTYCPLEDPLLPHSPFQIPAVFADKWLIILVGYIRRSASLPAFGLSPLLSKALNVTIH